MEGGVDSVSFFRDLFKVKTTASHEETKAPSRAIAFVDYEYWFYSYADLLHTSPNVSRWATEINEQYHVSDIMVFANLSYPKIQKEVQQLRTVTNTIIDTSYLAPGHKKNMTDFIMLDYMYQTAFERPEIDTYILFTGDGHFQSVAKFLSQKKRKTIILYGVRGTISKDLEAIAAKTVQLPEAQERADAVYAMIVNNLADVANNPRIIPTFNGTVSTVARKNGIDEEFVRISLLEMMDKGYIYQKDYRVEFNRKVKIVAANWELLAKNGLWSYDR